MFIVFLDLFLFKVVGIKDSLKVGYKGCILDGEWCFIDSFFGVKEVIFGAAGRMDGYPKNKVPQTKKRKY